MHIPSSLKLSRFTHDLITWYYATASWWKMIIQLGIGQNLQISCICFCSLNFCELVSLPMSLLLKKFDRTLCFLTCIYHRSMTGHKTAILKLPITFSMDQWQGPTTKLQLLVLFLSSTLQGCTPLCKIGTQFTHKTRRHSTFSFFAPHIIHDVFLEAFLCNWIG